MLPIRCPKCESTDLRSSLSQNWLERLGKVFGFFPLRCKDCDHRFLSAIWDVRHVLFARCPQCYRLDLNEWRPEQYNVPRVSRMLLAIGAKPHRCEACRRNFVGFRPAKMRYVRRRVTADCRRVIGG